MSDPAPGRPAVILDRDGTLNEEVGYLHHPADLVWTPGAAKAVRRLNDAGHLVLVVTNQAGVARGFYTEADVHTLHVHMNAELARYGAHVDAFYYSPYHPEGTVERYRRTSACRKPGRALYERAIADWGFDPARSVAVGDKATDLIPARALGMGTILVETGYGQHEANRSVADLVVPTFADAAEAILASPSDL